MSKQMINGNEVEVKVFAPDGTMEASAALTERELATVQAVDAALKANPEFQAAYPGARLEGVKPFYFGVRRAAAIVGFLGILLSGAYLSECTKLF